MVQRGHLLTIEPDECRRLLGDSQPSVSNAASASAPSRNSSPSSALLAASATNRPPSPQAKRTYGATPPASVASAPIRSVAPASITDSTSASRSAKPVQACSVLASRSKWENVSLAVSSVTRANLAVRRRSVR